MTNVYMPSFRPLTFKVNVTTSAWTTSGPRRTKTISVPGMMQTMVPEWDVDTTDWTTGTVATYRTIATESSKLMKLESNNGSITITTWDDRVPTVAIPLILKA